MMVERGDGDKMMVGRGNGDKMMVERGKGGDGKMMGRERGRGKGAQGQSILFPYLFSFDVGHSIHPFFEDLSSPL